MVRILLLLLLTSLGCVGKIPKWDGKIYAGDHEQRAVVRAQENEVIFTDDERFSNGLWMTYADFQSFYETYVLGCKQWKSDKLVPWQEVYKTAMPR